MFSDAALYSLLIPIIVEQFLNALMGMADTMMISNLGSAAISAVSLTDSINTLMIQVFAALAAGGTVICSQYLGQKNIEQCNKAAKQLLLVILVLSSSIAVFCLVFRRPLLSLIFGQVSAEVMDASLIYFGITVMSYPFFALFQGGAGLYRACGDSRLPMRISIITNMMNIVGNAVLVFVIPLGVAGAALSTLVVPVMAVTYVGICLLAILGNVTRLPGAIRLIVLSAFDPAAMTGGAIGTVFLAVQKGISRGVFSNEAGLGTAPIAAAAAKTNEPARQGLVCMMGTFVTIVICVMTGLVIVITGAWEPSLGLKGADITIEAFDRGLSFLPASRFIASLFLMLSLVFFAFTTILGWNYYAERCIEYIVGMKRRGIVRFFRFLYILAVSVGPYLTVTVVWGVADIFNGLMAFPNLIALVLLSPVVWRETRDYLKRHPKGTD